MKIKRSLYFTDRKRYYRNKKAREYYYRRKEKLLLEIKKEIPSKRLRKQVVYNCDYSISIRAIEINGKSTLKDLEDALNEFLFNNQQLLNINFSSTGLEEEFIDDNEDKGLKDNKIYIEINVRGSVTLI